MLHLSATQSTSAKNRPKKHLAGFSVPEEPDAVGSVPPRDRTIGTVSVMQRCGKRVTLMDANAQPGLHWHGINDYFLRISLLCPKEGHRRCVRSGR